MTEFDRGEENYVRSSLLLTGTSRRAVRVLFDNYFPPISLVGTLAQNFNTLDGLKKKRIINTRQWDILFPPHGIPTSDDFDLTLMVCLLRNLTRLSRPVTGFDAMPYSNDLSEGADLARIKYFRNMLAHCADNVDNQLFGDIWGSVPFAIGRIAGPSMEQEAIDLKTKFLDTTNLDIRLEVLHARDQFAELTQALNILKRNKGRYPLSVSIEEKTKESMTIRWDPPADIGTSNEDITGYRIIWKRADSNQDPCIEDVPSTDRSYIVQPLDIWTKYEIWMKALTDDSDADLPPCEKILETTAEGAPTESPQEIQFLKTTNSIEVYWNAPPKDTRNGEIVKYTVYYCSENGETIEKTTTKYRAVLDDLQPSTDYKIWVDCQTVAGKSPPSEPTIVRTSEMNDPDKLIPTSVHIKEIKSTSIEIQWEPPKCASFIDLQGYHLFWREKDDDLMQEKTAQVSSDSRCYNITNLRPWTRYKIMIRGFSEIRKLPSWKINVKTREEVPSGSPQSIQFIKRTDSIYLHWEPPPKNTRNGEVAGYTIYYARENDEEKKLNTLECKAHLENLKSSANYKIWVDCKTSAGHGPRSECCIVRTSDVTDSDVLIPTSVHTGEVTPTSVEMKWEPPTCASAIDLLGYHLVWREKDNELMEENTVQVPSDSRCYIITNLRPWTMYKILINGYSESRKLPGRKIQVKTREGVPLRPPQNILFSKTANSIDLSWEPPSISTRHGEIIGYTVYYKTEDGEKKRKPTTAQRAIIENLQPSTNYLVSVDCQTAVGTGPESDLKEVRTLDELKPIQNQNIVNASIEGSVFERATFQPGVIVNVIKNANNVCIGSSTAPQGSLTAGDEEQTPALQQ